MEGRQVRVAGYSFFAKRLLVPIGAPKESLYYSLLQSHVPGMLRGKERGGGGRLAGDGRGRGGEGVELVGNSI